MPKLVKRYARSRLLMQRFGVPVVTSNQATIDAAFEAVGVTAKWPMATAA
jgi:maleate isomerase